MALLWLAGGCSVLLNEDYGRQDPSPPDDAPIEPGRPAPQGPDGSPPVGGPLGLCDLGTGPLSSLRLTVENGWIPVTVCAPSGTDCGDGIAPPCICQPGTACTIPFHAESDVVLDIDMCGAWNGPDGAATTERFELTIGETPAVVLATATFCE